MEQKRHDAKKPGLLSKPEKFISARLPISPDYAFKLRAFHEWNIRLMRAIPLAILSRLLFPIVVLVVCAGAAIPTTGFISAILKFVIGEDLADASDARLWAVILGTVITLAVAGLGAMAVLMFAKGMLFHYPVNRRLARLLREWRCLWCGRSSLALRQGETGGRCPECGRRHPRTRRPRVRVP